MTEDNISLFSLLVFQFILPLIQIVIFFACIGQEPHDLDFGIVNHDLGGLMGNFSEEFVKDIDRHTFILVSNKITIIQDI